MSTSLPIEVQQALSQQQPVAPGPSIPAAANPDAGPAPSVDGTQPGMANQSGLGALLTAQQQPAAPAVTFGQKLARAATEIGIPPGPMGWAKSLVSGAVTALHNGGVQSAVNNITAGLGDAAAVGTVAPGQGALAGVSRTLAARNERLAQQHKQSEEDKTNEILRAHTAAQTLSLQQSMASADEEREDKHIASGQTVVSAYRKNHQVQDNVSEDELKKMIAASGGPGKFGDRYYVYQTGKTPILDGNGKPTGKFNPTYSVVTRQGGMMELDQATHDMWVKSGMQNVPPVGSRIPADVLDNQNTQAQKAADAIHLAEKYNEQAFTDEQKKQLNVSLAKVQPILAQNADDPIGALEQAKKNEAAHTAQQQQALAAAQKAGDQAGIKKAQDALAQIQQEGKDVDFALQYGFTTEAKEKHREANQRDEELRLRNKELLQRDQDRRDANAERNEGKKRQKLYDDAHDAWQKSLAKNDFNPVAAREDLRKTNPQALAALADEETRSAQVTESTDPITGETRQTTKSKPTFFAVPGQQNQPQTVGDVIQNPAAAAFQQSQNQQQQQAQQQQQQRQAQIDQRPAEPEFLASGGALGQPRNPNFNQAEKYISQHPELSGPDRAAIRQRFQQQQQQGQLPKPPQQGAQLSPADAAKYLAAAGGDKQKARQLAQQNGWNF